MLGGADKVVEVDEIKIGRRKYHRGKFVEGQWVFGLVERGSNKSIIVPVSNRSRQTLIPIIMYVHYWSLYYFWLFI